MPKWFDPKCQLNRALTNAKEFTRIAAASCPEDSHDKAFRAEAPATGIKRVLKPLFEIAIRKAVEKGLEEDRLDLEERGYGKAGQI